MKSWILAVFLSLVAIAPIFYAIYYTRTSPSMNPPVLTTVQFPGPKPNAELEAGAIFEVRACKVIDGYRFGMFLEGNRWIEAHLQVAVKDEAAPVVIEWLNKTTSPPPTVKLLRRAGNHWIVEFHLTKDEKRENVLTLLREKGLLLL